MGTYTSLMEALLNVGNTIGCKKLLQMAYSQFLTHFSLEKKKKSYSIGTNKTAKLIASQCKTSRNKLDQKLCLGDQTII